jgi:WD40 repeat protein
VNPSRNSPGTISILKQQRATLDKIVGTSILTRNNFSVSYPYNACAFPANGFVCIVTLSDKHRRDIQVTSDFRGITALSFSRNGVRLAVAEKGPNARVEILTFSSGSFDKILEKTEIPTRENGFSCIALDGDSRTFVTIGNDPQPFLLLWDLKTPTPSVTGHYRFNSTPYHLCLSPDCNFAFVCGVKLLKFISLTATTDKGPGLLPHCNANIQRFQKTTFVSVACSWTKPFLAYALSAGGCLCVYEAATIPLLQKPTARGAKRVRNLQMSKHNLNQGLASFLSLDANLLAVGTAKGSILAIKRAGVKYNVIGQYGLPDKSIIVVGVAQGCVISVSDDGMIAFWRRKFKSQPELTITSHREPVCDVSVCRLSVLSCGSDGSIRSWKFQKSIALVSPSLQEQEAEVRLFKKAEALDAITGVRTICCAHDDYIYAGLDTGFLNVLDDRLRVLQSIPDNSASVMSMAIQGQFLATGGGDGMIRVYTIVEKGLIRSTFRRLDTEPITSVVFTRNSFVASSVSGLFFMSLPNCEIFGRVPSDSPILTLAAALRPNLVVAAARGGSIQLFAGDNGRLFRSFQVSTAACPLAVAVHPSDLLFVLGMSDGSVIGIDPVSGAQAFGFQSAAGIITRMIFHEGYLIVASQGGFIMRWNLPQSLRIELEKQPGQPLLADPADEDFDAHIRQSFVASRAPRPEWIYTDLQNDAPAVDQEEAEEPDEAAEEDDVEDDMQNHSQFDAPRPVVEPEERNIDQFLRQSFSKKPSVVPKRESDEINQMTHRLTELLRRAGDWLGVEASDEDVVGAKRELKEMIDSMKPKASQSDATARELTGKIQGGVAVIGQRVAESQELMRELLQLMIAPDS